MPTYDLNYYTEIDLTVSAVDLALEKKCPIDWKYEEKKGRLTNGIVFALEGAAVYYMEDRTFAVKKNDVFFLRKGSHYTTVGDKSTNFQYIVVSFELTEDDIFLTLPFDDVLNVSNPLIYSRLFHELESLWFYRGISYKIKCKTLLQEILINALFDSIQHRINVNEITKIQPSISYIDNNYDKEIKVDNLAFMSKLSTTHFRRIFKKVYGISPLEYLTSVRINKAKDLIKSDLYSITEVAELCGFFDISYFSRIFKKFTGCCPMKFRDMN